MAEIYLVSRAEKAFDQVADFLYLYSNYSIYDTDCRLKILDYLFRLMKLSKMCYGCITEYSKTH